MVVGLAVFRKKTFIAAGGNDRFVFDREGADGSLAVRVADTDLLLAAVGL